MNSAVLAEIRRVEANQRCSKCGAGAWVGCGCGVKYLRPITAATVAILASPNRSDRAIAAEIGVGKDTVRRARTGAHAPVDKRVGRDGKARKQPQRPSRKAKPPLIHEECEECTTDEQRWQTSCTAMLGEMLSLRPYWRKEFGKWEKFEVTSALVKLAAQAAEELQELADHISSRGELK